MSTNARIAAVIALIVVAVVAFVALRPSDDDEKTASPATTPAATTTSATTSSTTPTTPTDATTSSTTPTTPTTVKPVPTIRVAGGEPVGGVKSITVKKGDQIRFRVVDDEPQNVHLHGYDIEKPVGPGQPARYSVHAEITGVFEIEIEDTGVQIGKLTVEP